MEAPSPSDDAVGLVRRWTVLIVLSGVFATGLEALRLPAALLLGPMIAAILVAVSGAVVRVPNRLFLIAQAVIGCMIARSIPPSIIGEILRELAAVHRCRRRGDRGEQCARLAAHALARAAGHHRRMGFVARRGLGDDADGGSLRRRHPPRCLHAVSARAVRRSGGHDRRQAVDRRRAAATAATDWFPPIAWVPFAETLALIGFGAACGAPAPHPGRAAAAAARCRHRAAGCRAADDRAAALAAGRQLHGRRLEHRPGLQPHDPAVTPPGRCRVSCCRSSC